MLVIISLCVWKCIYKFESVQVHIKVFTVLDEILILICIGETFEFTDHVDECNWIKYNFSFCRILFPSKNPIHNPVTIH